MSASLANSHTEPLFLEIQAFPACHMQDNEASAAQIASHIRLLLETFGTGHPASLKIPSPMVLADFYNRTVLDVLDALFYLKQQQFCYRMNGLDSEVTLYDPIGRKHNHDIACGWAFKPHFGPQGAVKKQATMGNIFENLFNYGDD